MCIYSVANFRTTTYHQDVQTEFVQDGICVGFDYSRHLLTSFAGCRICITAFQHHVLKQTMTTQFICTPVRRVFETVPQAITYTAEPCSVSDTVMGDAAPGTVPASSH